MLTDSISRPQSISAERFQRVVLPATVELIKSAIASSVLNADNAPSVVENIANAVARLSAKPGAHESDDFSSPASDISDISVSLQQVVKNYRRSYLSKQVEPIQSAPVAEPVKRKVGRPKKVTLQASSVTPAPSPRPLPPVNAPAAKIASPTRNAVSTSPITVRAPEPVVTPVKEISVPSLHVDLKRRKADTEPNTKRVEKLLKAPPESSRKLPKGLASIHDAIGEDFIVCLDDGRKVKDLEKHLESKGTTMGVYLKKWALPAQYPTRAPKLTLSKGVIREYDIHTGEFVEI